MFWNKSYKRVIKEGRKEERIEADRPKPIPNPRKKHGYRGYKLVPKEDITIYELAILISKIDNPVEELDNLEKRFKRHLKEIYI